MDHDEHELDALRGVARIAAEVAERRNAARPGSRERIEAEHELDRLEDVATFDEHTLDASDEETAAG